MGVVGVLGILQSFILAALLSFLFVRNFAWNSDHHERVAPAETESVYVEDFNSFHRKNVSETESVYVEDFNSFHQKSVSMPMYYTNLDASVARNERMQRVFGKWGRLIRVASVDAKDEEAVKAVVDTHGLPLDRYFKEEGGASGVGSGALLATKMLAIKQAYENGDEYMLLFEDDISEMFVPFWRWSLNDILHFANRDHPGWRFIQLDISLPSAKTRKLYDAWTIDPSTPFFRRDRILHQAYPWGNGSMMVSRAGMKDAIDRLFVGKNGKFDCLPEVKRLWDIGARCHPDNFFWRLEDPSTILLVIPPMFAPIINEGSTGVRDAAKGSVVSDHWNMHFRSMMAALQANVLAKAEQTFRSDFGVSQSAKQGGMWYMRNEHLKDVLIDFPTSDPTSQLSSPRP